MGSLFGGSSESNQSLDSITNFNPSIQIGTGNDTSSDFQGEISSETNPQLKDSMELSASAVVPVNSKTGDNKASSAFQKKVPATSELATKTNALSTNTKRVSTPIFTKQLLPNFNLSNNDKYIYAGLAVASLFAFYIIKREK